MRTAYQGYRLPSSCKSTRRIRSSSSKRVRYSLMDLDIVLSLCRPALISSVCLSVCLSLSLSLSLYIYICSLTTHLHNLRESHSLTQRAICMERERERLHQHPPTTDSGSCTRTSGGGCDSFTRMASSLYTETVPGTTGARGSASSLFSHRSCLGIVGSAQSYRLFTSTFRAFCGTRETDTDQRFKRKKGQKRREKKKEKRSTSVHLN